MKSLKKIQQDFHQAIFQKNSNLDFIASSFPVERLAIYKNTIFENIRHALEITFPGVWSLLGADCANSIVHRFCFVENHLPSTGCLDDFGENFPSYLGSLDILSTLPYIQDYALFEWLKHLAYTATKSPAITPDDLQQIHEDLLAEIKMTFVPSCYLFSSRFPIQEIDERAFNPQASNMLLSEKNNYGIITITHHNKILTHWIDSDIWHFIYQLKQGDTLIQSMNKVEKNHPDFDLTKAIHFLLNHPCVNRIIPPI